MTVIVVVVGSNTGRSCRTQYDVQYYKRFVKFGEDKYRVQLIISSGWIAFSKRIRDFEIIVTT